MVKLTVGWKNGKITETITDNVDWYIHVLRSNKQTYIWYMIEPSEPNSIVSNLEVIEDNIKSTIMN